MTIWNNIKRVTLGRTALIAGVLFVSHANAELVVNGGFESGNFSGWTTSSLVDASPYYAPAVNGTGVHSGSYAAHFGAGYGTSDTITQTLTTTPGQQYTVTFAYGEYNANDPLAEFGYLNTLNPGWNDPNDPDYHLNPDSPYFQINDLVFNWGGSQGFHDANFFTSDQGETNVGDTYYKTASLAFTATDTSTDIQFIGSDNQQDIVLDDVSVTEVTPEPATSTMIGLGLATVAAVRRKRKA